MLSISQKDIENYRTKTFHLLSRFHLHNERDAIKFVNECGFAFFWPVKNALLPSLWNATVGDRPVPDNHDDPGHITWRWKDNLLGKKKLYYARVLRKRNTFIALSILPNFYTLSPNYGDPENDYLLQYKEGLLSIEAKSVYEVILSQGPLDTLSLKRASMLSSPGNESRFNRALDKLQADFRLLPVGIAEAGTWHYAFIYDAVHRHFPELINISRNISENVARQTLLQKYMKTVGACQIYEPQRIFQWGQTELELSLNELIKSGTISKAQFQSEDKSIWIVHKDLFQLD